MQFRLTVKVLLAAVALVAVTAIGWSLLSRGGGGTPTGELLDPGIARESTDFEHVEYKRGSPVFRVRSKVDTLTEVGEHRLREVRLTVYGPNGDATDWVVGQNATYQIEAKRIEFEGQVEAGLSDGTLLFSERLGADLAAETLAIERDFRFKRGEVEGSGRGLLYEIGGKTLSVDSDFKMENPAAEAPFSLSAARAVYAFAESRLSLAGDVRLSGTDYRMGGGEMLIHLTPERRVERIEDAANASFVSGDRSFSGRRILIYFDTQTARLREFRVLGGDGGPVRTRAVFEQRTPRGRHRLQADRILGVPNPRATDPGRFQLETFEAEGETLFSSPGLGIDRATSSRVVGAFDGSGGLRQMDMFGGVLVDRTLEGGRQRLKGRRLRLAFGQDQRVERGAAHSDAELTVWGAAGMRRLSARQSLVMDFREGLLSRVTASGGCRLETVEGASRSEVTAPAMLALFSDGLVDRVTAGDGVLVLIREGGVEQRTEGLQLRLVYDRGRLKRVVQSGEFRYRETAPGRRIELEASEAVFRPELGRIVAVGRDPQPRLLQTSFGPDGAASVSETRADRFQMEREGGGAMADGAVSTRRPDSERPFVIESRRMAANPETGAVVYSGEPRLREGDSYISGERITLQDEDRTMLVERGVESFFSGKEGDKVSSCRISAGRAKIRPAENKVLYEKAVRVRCEEMSMEAPSLELRFGDDGLGELEEAFAWGGVLITDPSRRAAGEKAYYHPLERKVTVLGDKAEVVDSKQGRATGAELTFFLGDERIIIEGPVKPQP